MKKAAGVVAVAGLPGCPGASPVPGFLAKLWALVEDPESDDVISWSRNGQNFCIWDEQKFAKELLPKYFKHNNLSSFIRQLNIYGFRKVIALENGMMTYRNSATEFQHPFFKQGKANLLANIKRKVSAVRTEDLKACPEDLHKVLSEVQEMREQQNNMDMKLASMKRENKALWKEVASLRQKHSQQQQLLSKILEFILSLMRGNCILGLKRKRPLPDSSGASPSKYSRQYVHIPVEDCEATALSESPSPFEDSIVIRDITDVEEEEGDETKTDRLLALAHPAHEKCPPQLSPKEAVPFCEALEFSEDGRATEQPDQQLKGDPASSSAVELHSAQGGANEDAAAVIDSILNENQTAAATDSLLDREEIQDFLNCIDASLEELQAMLSGKKLNSASEMLNDSFSTDLPALDVNLTEIPSGMDDVADLPESISTARTKEPESSEKNDMQVIQYRGNPLVSLLEDPPADKDGCTVSDTQDILPPSLDSRPSDPLALGPEAPQQLLNPAILADGATTLESLHQPLLPEGDDKLFPLLLFSPVANFIEEAPETDTC